MKNNNYNIGDYVWLIDQREDKCLYKIIDITDRYYILEEESDYEEGWFNLYAQKNIYNVNPGFVAFEIKNFNPKKVSDEEIKNLIGDYDE